MQISSHDNCWQKPAAEYNKTNCYSIKGDLSYWIYWGVFSYYIPLWFSGEEWNSLKSRDYASEHLYGNVLTTLLILLDLIVNRYFQIKAIHRDTTESFPIPRTLIPVAVGYTGTTWIGLSSKKSIRQSWFARSRKCLQSPGITPA